MYEWNGACTVNIYSLESYASDPRCLDCFTFGHELAHVPVELAIEMIELHIEECGEEGEEL